jgi:hypothetical protein
MKTLAELDSVLMDQRPAARCASPLAAALQHFRGADDSRLRVSRTPKIADINMNCDYQADVVVVGSGAAGLTAAILAHDNGARVIVVERTNKVGGTTAVSGGGIWIPLNHHMDEHGFRDTRAEAVAYCKQLAMDRVDLELIETLFRSYRFHNVIAVSLSAGRTIFTLVDLSFDVDTADPPVRYSLSSAGRLMHCLSQPLPRSE